MNEKNKEEKSSEETQETKEKESPENLEESSSKDDKDDADLDEALKAEQTRNKAKERFEEKGESKDTPDKEDDDDKPLTRKELKQLLDEQAEATRKEVRMEQAKDIAKSLADNPKLANLTLEIWKNRRLAGTLAEQMAEAHAIAVSKRIKAENNELKRALAGKETEETTGEQAQRKPDQNAPKLGTDAKQVLAGYVFDPSKRAYKKTIAGGRKILFVSSDLKKRWTEDAPKK